MSDVGCFKIRCVKSGGLTLVGYGAFHFDENQEVDLLDPSLPATLRCATWGVAQLVCSDPSTELAQLVANGALVVSESRKPRPPSSAQREEE